MTALSDHVNAELALTDLTEEAKVSIRLICSLYDGYGYFRRTDDNVQDLIHDLVKFKNLTPLTDDPDEWVQVADNIWKNKRRGDAFSLNGGKTYYYARNGTSSTNPWPQHVSYPHKETNND